MGPAGSVKQGRPARDHRLLGRREAIITLGRGIGAAWCGWYAAGAAIGSLLGGPAAEAAMRCVLSPEQTAGPFYSAGEPFRADITEDRSGVPLVLRLRVQDGGTCRRLRAATVEVWHCDATGNYSGFSAGTEGTSFLRGGQRTDRAGRVGFRTIYPGWYPGRTPHIHVRVHTGGTLVHTGQLYFDDAVSDRVYARTPYAARGPRDTMNASDGIFTGGGPQSLLRVRRVRGGYRARATLVVGPA
jgi:protocatechuate 3,4-dioxygenase beta subunit